MTKPVEVLQTKYTLNELKCSTFWQKGNCTTHLDADLVLKGLKKHRNPTILQLRINCDCLKYSFNPLLLLTFISEHFLQIKFQSFIDIRLSGL